MKKQLRKLVLGTLSASLFLAMVPITSYATDDTDSAETTEETAETAETEETEETTEEEATESGEESTDSESAEDSESMEEDLTPSADNPYTEAEITELIKPTNEWDPNLVMERDALETGYEEVLETAKERATNGETNLSFEDVVRIMGEDPTSVSETDNGEIFRYVAIEDDIVIVVTYQTYLNSEERGVELTNVDFEYRTAKMFERLETSVEELQELYNAGDVEAFEEKFGQPQFTTTSLFTERFTETLLWSVVGNEEVEVGEVAAVEVQLENDEMTNLAYYEQEETDASDTEESTESDDVSAEEETEESAE
ncbi:hypothetical protein ACF3NG_04480 [Aerococcaceae bacterium WGS1372]